MPCFLWWLHAPILPLGNPSSPAAVLSSGNILFSLCAFNPRDGNGFLPLLVWESHPALCIPLILPLNLCLLIWKLFAVFVFFAEILTYNPLPIFLSSCWSFSYWVVAVGTHYSLVEGWGQTFSVKGQTVNIFGFVCHMVSVATAQRCQRKVKAAPNKMQTGLPWRRSGWESACQCRGHGFEPWSGTIPHAAEQLGPWATTTEPARLEPVLRNKRGRNSERPAHRDEEWPPLAATGQSPRTETKTQHSQK